MSWLAVFVLQVKEVNQQQKKQQKITFKCGLELGRFKVQWAERIYRSAAAATDCHWSCSPSRVNGPSVRSETGAGATGPMP